MQSGAFPQKKKMQSGALSKLTPKTCGNYLDSMECCKCNDVRIGVRCAASFVILCLSLYQDNDKLMRTKP